MHSYSFSDINLHIQGHFEVVSRRCRNSTRERRNSKRKNIREETFNRSTDNKNKSYVVIHYIHFLDRLFRLSRDRDRDLLLLFNDCSSSIVSLVLSVSRFSIYSLFDTLYTIVNTQLYRKIPFFEYLFVPQRQFRELSTTKIHNLLVRQGNTNKCLYQYTVH